MNHRRWIGFVAAAVAAIVVIGVLAVLVGARNAVTQGTDVTQDKKACSESVDVESFSDVLDKTTFQNSFVGNLSGLASGTDGSLLAVSDRSLLFTLDPRTKQPTHVVTITDANGTPLDSEAVTADGADTRWIASEVEPSVRRYSTDGALLGELPVPDALRVAPAGGATENQTFEGLSLQPDARTLIASVEGTLSGDAADVRRFQTWTRASPVAAFALAAQYGYVVDPGLDVADVAATPDGRLLVVERGFAPGVGNTVRLILADWRRADDIGGVDNLTAQTGSRFIGKTVLADLADCPTLGAMSKQPQVNPLLDNVEGVVVTREDGHGRLRLLLVSDDNESRKQVTRFLELTVVLPKP